MRTALVTISVLVLVAAPVAAGKEIRGRVSGLPSHVVVGRTVAATLHVWVHTPDGNFGIQSLAGTVEARRVQSRQVVTFTLTPTTRMGYYRLSGRLPRVGRWTLRLSTPEPRTVVLGTIVAIEPI